MFVYSRLNLGHCDYLGKTPASLMMNRGIKTKIPTIIPAPTTVAHKEAQQKDAAAKARQKEYADKHRRATDRQYKVGDTVLLHQKKTTTKPPYDPNPFTVTHTQGTKITATRRGKEVTRNVDKWKILKTRPHYFHTIPSKPDTRQPDDDDDFDFDLPSSKQAPHRPPPQQHQQDEEDRGHEAPAGPPAQPASEPPGHAARQRATLPRERWEVANGPWRTPQGRSSPSPRERKRRQGAARRRDKEENGTYWLRSRGKPREDSEDSEEEE